MNGVIGEALDIIRSISGLPLISHGVRITGVNVSTVIHIYTKVFVITIVSIMTNKWHNELRGS